jgi:hypothetical protein
MLTFLNCRATGNLDRCTPVGDLHAAFKIPYVHDCVTILGRKQAEVIQMYAQLDKEKPCVGSISVINLATGGEISQGITCCTNPH